MLKKAKKCIMLLLAMSMLLGMSTSVFAAEKSQDTVEINLFDPNDPNLIAIVDAIETRTTSRPTSYYYLDTQGQYSYSAYSSNNIMWTKYIFGSSDGASTGSTRFRITASSTNTNYRMVVHNCSNNKDYYYSISSTSVSFYQSNLSGWTSSPYFYFGVDTTASKSAVSVSGIVDTY